MFPFRRAEIHVPGYGSSMDPEVKANSGRPAATCRLLKSSSAFLLIYVDIRHKNKLTFCLVQFAHDLLYSFYRPARYSISLLPLASMKYT
jgi:hypothetical protein